MSNLYRYIIGNPSETIVFYIFYNIIILRRLCVVMMGITVSYL